MLCEDLRNGNFAGTCLRNQGQSAPEIKQSHLCDVEAINVDGARCRLNYPEESLQIIRSLLFIQRFFFANCHAPISVVNSV